METFQSHITLQTRQKSNFRAHLWSERHDVPFSVKEVPHYFQLTMEKKMVNEKLMESDVAFNIFSWLSHIFLIGLMTWLISILKSRLLSADNLLISTWGCSFYFFRFLRILKMHVCPFLLVFIQWIYCILLNRYSLVFFSKKIVSILDYAVEFLHFHIWYRTLASKSQCACVV